MKKMEKKMHKIFPEYLPLKNLKEEKEDHDDNYEPMDEKVEDELDIDQRKNLSIVDIYFCFDQTSLMKLLTKRGKIYSKYRSS